MWLKDRLAHSVASTNLLPRKMAKETDFTTMVLPAKIEAKIATPIGSGYERF